MPRERTYIMIKPDGVQRGLIGEIIGRFEAKGFKLVALKLCTPTKEHLETHYADLKTKKFFPGLISYMMMGPVVAMVWEGDNAVKTGRVMLGATNPADSAPGTIRGDLCIDVGRNICHGSDSVESANHEIALWFTPEELNNYRHHSEAFVYENVLEEEAAPAPAAAPAAAEFTPFTGEYNECCTYDDHPSWGKKFPSIESLKIVPKGHHDDAFKPGKPALFVFFAKYLKYEAFAAVEAASDYAQEFGLQTCGVVLDNKEKDVARFIEKKPCRSDFALYFDKGWLFKKDFQRNVLSSDTLPMPSLCLVNADGTVAYFQALSGMSGVFNLAGSQFDYQIRQFMAGKPFGMHGHSGQVVESDDVEGPVKEEDVFASQEVADAVW